MNPPYIIQELDNNYKIIDEILRNTSREMSIWRPKEDKWCLLEIICHLNDEENEDFGARLRSILNDPYKPLPPIDPLVWVEERKYLEQNFQKKSRLETISWLQSLKNPNWDNSYQHPTLGAMSAKHMLANWLAHDYIHIRQILNLKYEYLSQNQHGDLSYAGNW
jgi:hypothetical protein